MNRRDMLRAAALGGAWALLGRGTQPFARLTGAEAEAAPSRLAQGPEAGEPGKRPNILLILADDMGFSDLGCFGGEAHTPNIDRLAAEGVRFTHGYNNARCCPTRASLLTGLYPHEAGVGHMLNNTGLSGYTPALNDRCVTLAEALRPAGYTTMHVGKWHVGAKRPHWPVDRGFDESFTLLGGGSNYFRPAAQSIVNGAEYYTPPEKDFYLTDAFSDQAVKFLDKHGKGPKPFFMYLAFTAPHFPLQAPPEEIKKYLDLYAAGWDKLRAERYKRQLDMGLIDPRWKLSDRDAAAWDTLDDPTRKEKILRMAVYSAQIDRMDQGVGRVLAKLRELGVEDDTLVMFWSDNGGCAEVIERGRKEAATGTEESYRSYSRPWANVSDTPFRFYKHWVHEGGISTPVIARWPKVITQHGGFITDVCHVIDIMPTLVEVAGAEYPKTFAGHGVLPMEGASLAPILEGKAFKGHDPLDGLGAVSLSNRAIFWEHEGNRAVWQGKWKIVAAFNTPWELYDMDADRTELTNLADKMPDKVKEMSALWDAWAKRTNVEPWDKVQKARAPRPQPAEEKKTNAE